MKNIDKKYFKVAVYALLVILCAILFANVLDNMGTILTTISLIFAAVKKLAFPFIIGFFIAYLFNPLVMLAEEKWFGRIPLFQKSAGTKRTVSILTVYILVIGCFAWLMTFFIPEIVQSVSNFIATLPQNTEALEKSAEVFFENVSFIDAKDVLNTLTSLFTPMIEMTQDIPKILQTVVNGTYVAASTTLNVIMGLFISFYMLSGKETFLKSIKKIVYAFFEEKKATHFLYNVSRVNSIFSSFIIGKTVDSLIIGIICFFGLALLKMPFVMLISVIVGVTNMIPYFGPFLGAIPSVFIVLLTSPTKALLIALFILALQQFDGNYLGPKILGSSTGMSPLWIIFSIIIGGALAGPFGMFIGVPICASLKMFFTEKVDKKYAEKYYYDIAEKSIEPPLNEKVQTDEKDN